MLLLLFQLGGERYALDCAEVIEVLPLVSVAAIARAPAGVAGVISYRGAPVPVLDLHAMTLGHPAARRMNTRIVLVNWPQGEGSTRPLGLIAEKVNSTMRRDPGQFTDIGIAQPDAPYLGKVASDEHGLVRWVDIGQLVSPEVRAVLFAGAAA